MNLSECISAAGQAWELLAAYGIRWLVIITVFLVIVEGLMLIPFVGFLVKLAVAGILLPQIVALFAQAAQGHAPNPTGLLGALSFSPSTMVVLAGAAILPFAVGIGFLYLKGGVPAIAFFFGNILKDKPPAEADFLLFKYVIQLAAIPFTLLAGAVGVKGLAGLEALTTTLSATLSHWLPVLLLALFALAFEWASGQLTSFLPRSVAAVVGTALLFVYLAFTFAYTYTVSERVFASSGPPPIASPGA